MALRRPLGGLYFSHSIPFDTINPYCDASSYESCACLPVRCLVDNRVISLCSISVSTLGVANHCSISTIAMITVSGHRIHQVAHREDFWHPSQFLGVIDGAAVNAQGPSILAKLPKLDCFCHGDCQRHGGLTFA
jgi:hypothetical protein